MRQPVRCPVLPLPSLFIISLTCFPILAANSALGSVPQVSPDWSLEFESAVEWQRVTPLGHLLVKTTTALSAIDPETGEVIWSHGDLSGLAEEHYGEIPGTPFVTLCDGLSRPRVVIINSIDGTVVFDSKQSGVSQVLDQYAFPRNRSLMLLGFRQGKPATTMFMFDVSTGRLLWENDQLLGKAGKFTKLLTALVQAATNESGIVAEPMEISSHSFLMASSTDLYRIDTRSGKIEWQVSNAQGTRETRFFTSEETPGIVYVGSETATRSGTGEYITSFYSAFRQADGHPVWPKPVKLQGGLNEVIFTDRGLIVSPLTTGKGKIRLIEYAGGRSVWGKKGKGIEVLGGIVDHDWTGAGIVLTTGYDSAWSNKGTQYYLNILDVDAGALRFKDPLKVKGRILSTEVLPTGILFITTSEVNILDLATGKQKFTDSIRSDESLVTGTVRSFLYAFSADEGALYRVDKKRGTMRKLSQTAVKLEEDEIPMVLEVSPDRITLVSSQNIVAFTLDGELEFHAYHPSPRQPALMRVLLRAQQVRMGMAAFAAGSASGAFAHAATQQKPESLERTVSATVAQGYGTIAKDLASLSGRYGEMARARFKASALSADSLFMMVKLDRRSYGIARVSKKTGEIQAVINLGRDKEPSYEVDSVTDQIFYRPKSTEIVGFRF